MVVKGLTTTEYVTLDGAVAKLALEHKGPFKGWFQLVSIVVPEGVRRQGIGTELLHIVMNGLPFVYLIAVPSGAGMTNEQLFNWYEKHGFQRTFGYGKLADKFMTRQNIASLSRGPCPCGKSGA